jgi:hypothetical protein
MGEKENFEVFIHKYYSEQLPASDSSAAGVIFS